MDLVSSPPRASDLLNLQESSAKRQFSSEGDSFWSETIPFCPQVILSWEPEEESVLKSLPDKNDSIEAGDCPVQSLGDTCSAEKPTEIPKWPTSEEQAEDHVTFGLETEVEEDLSKAAEAKTSGEIKLVNERVTNADEEAVGDSLPDSEIIPIAGGEISGKPVPGKPKSGTLRNAPCRLNSTNPRRPLGNSVIKTDAPRSQGPAYGRQTSKDLASRILPSKATASRELSSKAPASREQATKTAGVRQRAAQGLPNRQAVAQNRPAGQKTVRNSSFQQQTTQKPRNTAAFCLPTGTKSKVAPRTATKCSRDCCASKTTTPDIAKTKTQATGNGASCRVVKPVLPKGGTTLLSSQGQPKKSTLSSTQGGTTSKCPTSKIIKPANSKPAPTPKTVTRPTVPKTGAVRDVTKPSQISSRNPTGTLKKSTLASRDPKIGPQTKNDRGVVSVRPLKFSSMPVAKEKSKADV